MTSTWRHITDLDVDEWAALTRRAAAEAVAAAERRGKTPPAELVAVAGMTERQLVEHRTRNGPARQRLSPVMQLVEADHLRRTAETFLSDRGVSGEDRGQLLSHGLERNPLVRRHYDRAERLDRKAELLAMWQAYATTKAPKRERARNG